MNKLLAEVSIGNELSIGNNKTIGGASQFSTPGALISIILKNVYILAGILLLFLIIAGGVSIISGAGGNDPKKTASGKHTITNAIIGFLIIFASYWIIRIIEIITGVNIMGGGGVG